jgi:hypothetical protein
MWVGTEGAEDTRDVSTLECVGYLHTEKTEAQVPELPKT